MHTKYLIGANLKNAVGTYKTFAFGRRKCALHVPIHQSPRYSEEQMLCENQNILKQQQFTELKDQKSRSTINHVGPTLNLLHSDYFPEINYAEKSGGISICLIQYSWM